MEWTKLTDRIPYPDEYDRVLIYTEGYDFAGEQFFDVKTETLNGLTYENPEDQPEVCRLASHWCPHPMFMTPSTATASGSELSDGLERTPQPTQEFGIIDPDYARVFTQARIVAWQFGYACMAHGSFTRDLDLLLVPWADRHVPEASGVVDRIADVCGLRLQAPPSDKPHGRRAWTLLFPDFGDVRWVDVSAFDPPPKPKPPSTVIDHPSNVCAD